MYVYARVTYIHTYVYVAFGSPTVPGSGGAARAGTQLKYLGGVTIKVHVCTLSTTCVQDRYSVYVHVNVYVYTYFLSTFYTCIE